MVEEELKYKRRIKELELQNSNLKEKVTFHEAQLESNLNYESKLKAALQSMSDAVFISDADGNFVDFNVAFATFHRFKNKQECYRSLYDFPEILNVFSLDGKLLSLDQWAVPRALRGESGINEEFKLLRKDTKEEWIGRYNFAPIKDDNGRIVGSVVTARDISLYKKVESDLIEAKDKAEESERLIHNIIDTSTDFIYVKDKNLKTVICNEAFAKSIHKKPSELIGRTDIENGWNPEFVHGNPEKGIVGYEESDLEALSGNVVQYIDRATIAGKTHYFDSVKTPLKDPDNNVIGVLGISRDITQRKKAELALIKQKKLLQDAEMLTQLGSWEYDFHNDEVFWSDGLFEIFKRSPSEGAPKWADQRSFYLEESYLRLAKAVDECIEYGTSYEVKVQAIRSDNQIRTCISRGKRERDQEGKITRLWGTFEDITEREKIEQDLRDSEERFKNMFEFHNAVMLLIDPESGKIMDANHSAANYYGYSISKLCSMNIAQINLLTSEQIKTEREHAIKFKRNHFTFNHKLASGKIRTVEVHSSPIELRDKRILFSIIHDVTEQKKAEKALKESNLAKDKIFSIIAHDLRSPFNNVISFMDILVGHTKEFQEAELERYLSLLKSSAKSTLGLLDNLLNWARSQTGKIEYNPEEIYLSTVIKEVFDYSIPLAEKKDINLTYSETDQVAVFADHNMITTILRNLISNAIKFTKPKGDVQIRETHNDEFVEISVSDTGIGMDKKTQDSLFELETSHSTRGTSNEKGTGLGLLLCKDFVEKHEGKIWVESQIDTGSTFKFTLPIHP